MTQRVRPIATLILLIMTSGLCFGVAGASAAEVPVIRVQATPDEGLQPRMVTDSEGVIHLLYFKKRLNRPAAREGNLYYSQYLPEQGRFGAPVRVSSQAFNVQSYAIARASLAVDGEGRIHVMWYLPRDEAYYYTRSNPERSAFEAQRSMVTDNAIGLDASGDVAALDNHVAIVWGAGDLSREDERTMFARFSHDYGVSFGRETMISNPDLGACACCVMAADYLDGSDMMVAYRSAIDGIGRHMQLLTVNGIDNAPTGSTYGPVHELQKWEASFCPLSTNDIAIDQDGQRWLVFETESRIVQMPLPEGEPTRVGEPFIETRQKNPAVAFNAAGQRLVAWGEAISHTRGGRLNMRLFEADGSVADFAYSDEVEIADFSFPAAAALPDGSFLVLH